MSTKLVFTAEFRQKRPFAEMVFLDFKSIGAYIEVLRLRWIDWIKKIFIKLHFLKRNLIKNENKNELRIIYWKITKNENSNFSKNWKINHLLIIKWN